MKINNKKYMLDHVMVHSPSEHTIGGRYYPAEIQLVHRHKKKNTIRIMAIMLEVESAGNFHVMPNNSFFDTVWRSVGKNGPVNENHLLDPYSELLPASLEYFSYYGSLTTPPCTENVKWMVYADARAISPTDLNMIRSSINDGNDNDGNLSLIHI